MIRNPDVLVVYLSIPSFCLRLVNSFPDDLTVTNLKSHFAEPVDRDCLRLSPYNTVGLVFLPVKASATKVDLSTEIV
jgi:hypothetical protein